MLPAITLDVEPTDAGLHLLSTKLTAFAQQYDLPEAVTSRMVSVASEAADVVAHALDAPPVARLLADADVGPDDAQLVLIAGDHRLHDVFASIRPRLDRIASLCDGFTAELAPGAELQVWACFRLGNGARP